jgi:hypothetical protein
MTKFKKKYYFNDGLDGVVIAKSLKHAVNILCKNGYRDMKNEILDGIKKSEKDPYADSAWYVEVFKTTGRRSEMLGWYE